MTELHLSGRYTGFLRKCFIAIYWIVLPLSVLLTIGWAVGTAFAPLKWQNWFGMVGMLTFSCAVGWRLWLNRRATGLTSSLPSRARLLRVFVPLGLLSLVGFVVAALGIAWLMVGTALLKEPGLNGEFQIAAGVLVILLGLALCWPFWSRLAATRTIVNSPSVVEETV